MTRESNSEASLLKFCERDEIVTRGREAQTWDLTLGKKRKGNWGSAMTVGDKG